MEFTTALFYVFAAILIFAALRVITDRNPVHAALFLVLSFFSAAAIWLLLQAEFLAIVLVLVYVGAVMVLFMFVVMMLDISLDKVRIGFWNYLPLAATIGVVIALEMAAVLMHSFQHDVQPPAAGNIGGTRELGMLLYTEYVYAFELAAVVLLVAMVSAVALTLRNRRKDSKLTDPSAALKVRRDDRIRIVRMESESTRANGNGGNAGDAAPAAEPATEKQ